MGPDLVVAGAGPAGLVAGAGPAGLVAARDVARAGLQVLVLEDHPEIGVPLHCSGLVSTRTLELAGITPDGIVMGSLRGAQVHTASGQTILLEAKEPQALAIDRVAFDRRLADQAQEAGAAIVMNARLKSIERNNGHLRLSIAQGEQKLSLETKLLIGADGASSVVARWLGIDLHDGAVRAAVTEMDLPHLDHNHAHIFVGQDLAPGWFGWVIPTGDGRARVGIGTSNGHLKPPKQLLTQLVERYPEVFSGVRVKEAYGGLIPLYAPTKTYAGNVLLVGDAARQVKPASGGGIYTSMLAATHAARTAIKALELDDCSEGFLADYESFGALICEPKWR